MKKKLIATMMIGALALSMAACGAPAAEEAPAAPEEAQEEAVAEEATEESSAPEENTTLVNDSKYDVTEEEMTTATGIDLPAPEGATDVTYNIICASEEFPIAEMEFTLDGHSAYVRAQFTQLLPWDQPGADASLEEIQSAQPTTDYDISGLYYEYDSAAATQVSYCDAYAYCSSDEGAGLMIWLDVVPGILYNLGMPEGADLDTLQRIADSVFVPMQGDA